MDGYIGKQGNLAKKKVYIRKWIISGYFGIKVLVFESYK